MLPRRCTKCRCYIAPQLQRCPRCRTVAPPSVASKPTSEEKQAARAKRDAKTPLIRAKNIHWVPSAFALREHAHMVEELKRRLAKADSPRLRNTIRSEMRATNATLARATIPAGKHAWTSEIFHAKQSCVWIFISPKKHRYILATKDGPADLIIESRKKHRGMPFIRLQRFEKSPYARMVKKEQRDDATHQKRRAVKKAARAQKRQRARPQ